MAHGSETSDTHTKPLHLASCGDKVWAKAKETVAEALEFRLGCFMVLGPRLSSPRTWGSVGSLI